MITNQCTILHHLVVGLGLTAKKNICLPTLAFSNVINSPLLFQKYYLFSKLWNTCKSYTCC